MEYYTKSEGLGFLIGESRIDFRIEFRGVSILCEFNSSTHYGFRRIIIRRSSTYLGLSRPTWSLMATTKGCYGHTRTHQRSLVSHDQHGLTWPSPNCTLRGGSRRQYRWFNVFKFKWSQMTTRRSYRDSGTSAGHDSIQMSSFLGFPFQVTG